MRKRFIIALGYLLATSWVQAATSSEEADLVVVCFAKESHIFVTTATRMAAVNSHLKSYHGGADRPDFVESFNSNSFVKWSGEYRKGTKRIQRKCGAIQISISANFLNSDPQGADGTTVFPTITLTSGKNTIAPETSIAEECDGDSDRFGDCAKDYAVEVSSSMSSSPGRYRVEYLRQFRNSLHPTLMPESAKPVR